jgi:uncharacterized protein YecT (DUF1311 family)
MQEHPMRLRMTMVALVLAAAAAAAAQESAPQKKPPKAPPQDNPCKTATTQLAMNECAEQARMKADATMTKAYNSLLKALDEDHGPLLQKSQKAWEKFREAECQLQSSQFLGGSAQGQLYGDCMAAMAADRTAALKDTRKTLADFVSR